MVVKDLIKKLEQCDPNATVIVENDDTYFSGLYTVTEVVDCEDGNIIIGSNHEKLVEKY